jgi:CubicO group peptidase (beta-lactamase class C family)
MSKYLKYLIVGIILLFSNFIVSTSTLASSSDDTAMLSTTTLESIGKELVMPIYPELLTQNISKKLDSVFNRFNKRHDFHGSILVAKNGKLLYSKEIGYADFKKRTELDKYSVFQLASVSKQFTATAIMILNERGLLDLDDLVTKYYPNFPYEDVTVQHLLNHTSGLPKYFWLAEHKWEKEKAPTNNEMMQMLAYHKVERFFRPGRNFDYSNTGYFVLASIVEKVTDMKYGDFMEANIFDPLQMRNSFVYSYENDSIGVHQLSGYRVYRGRYHIEIGGTVNDAIVGDKNVYATSEDLFKWINGLNSGKIISKESLDRMYTKGETVYGRKIPYGFGFRIDTKNDEKVIYHHGKWNGFSTSITQYTDSDLLIIALEHSSYSSMKHLNNTVRRIVEENFDPMDSDLAVINPN